MKALSPAQIIATYERVAAIMGRMRIAAQSANWNELKTLEAHCAKLVAILQRSPEAAVLSQSEKRRKFELLRQLLADDAEIRRHTEPWMEKLKSLIHTTSKTRKVNQAYGVGGKPAAGTF